ncbi:MAG TPA: trypsin-like serine protease, partial [Streptomyces sp.]|nr:trypsin-like serine protease [Streptomyces sp.]
MSSASGAFADTSSKPDALDVRIAKAMAADDTAKLPERQPSSSASSDGGMEQSAQIIGGSTTTIASAPWMAQLWYYDPTQDLGFFCGGTVVSPTKILTAAHCVDKDYFNWVEYGEIITGTDQLPTAVYNDDGSLDHVDYHGGTRSTLSRQWNHSSWNEDTIDNDVAVLTLSSPVKATPIKMTTSGDTASYTAGTSAKVYGWGRTSSKTQDISQTLK